MLKRCKFPDIIRTDRQKTDYYNPLIGRDSLSGGVTRSTISMGQVLTCFFSETAAFVKKSAHLKPIKYGLLPFGAYFKG